MTSMSLTEFKRKIKVCDKCGVLSVGGDIEPTEVVLGDGACGLSVKKNLCVVCRTTQTCWVCEKIGSVDKIPAARLTLESGGEIVMPCCTGHRAGIRRRGVKVVSIKRKGV